MIYKNFDIVNFEGFIDQYMGTDTEPFVFQLGAIQVYPLSMATSFIRAPTPLFRARYNFLLLFLNGGGEQQIDNEVIKLVANDALFIREGHLNAIKSIEPATDGYYIHIDNAFLPQSSIDRALLNHLTFYGSVAKFRNVYLCPNFHPTILPSWLALKEGISRVKLSYNVSGGTASTASVIVT